MNVKTRLVVLVSGSGTNLQAVLDAKQTGVLQVEIAAVISNKPDAYGLERARKAGVAALAFPKGRGVDRCQYDRELAQIVLSYCPDWVLLAGWMRLLTMEFLQHFPNRVMNIHPALPGMFPGTHAIERAWAAYQMGEIDHTGVMVHLVPDEGIDNGPVLEARKVPIWPEDTLESLEARIHAVEHQLYVDTVRRVTGEIALSPLYEGGDG